MPAVHSNLSRFCRLLLQKINVKIFSHNAKTTAKPTSNENCYVSC